MRPDLVSDDARRLEPALGRAWPLLEGDIQGDVAHAEVRDLTRGGDRLPRRTKTPLSGGVGWKPALNNTGLDAWLDG